MVQLGGLAGRRAIPEFVLHVRAADIDVECGREEVADDAAVRENRLLMPWEHNSKHTHKSQSSQIETVCTAHPTPFA